MTSQPRDFLAAVSAVESFTGEELTRRVASLEQVFTGSSAITAHQLLGDSGVTHDILGAAYALKRIAGQVNVVIHVLGILLCLPHLLETDERVEYLSLGAGNTGKAFDLETNLRVAEFKFIHWRRKSNVIRENALFKDLYLLAEHPTTKRKFMYVLDTAQPMKFLNGRRALRSVMSRNRALWDAFQTRYAGQYARVGDYYAAKGGGVTLASVADILVELGAADMLEITDHRPEAIR